jgi:hypothetical protein
MRLWWRRNQALDMFNDMQSLGVWRAVQIEDGNLPVGLDPVWSKKLIQGSDSRN